MVSFASGNELFDLVEIPVTTIEAPAPIASEETASNNDETVIGSGVEQVDIFTAKSDDEGAPLLAIADTFIAPAMEPGIPVAPPSINDIVEEMRIEQVSNTMLVQIDEGETALAMNTDAAFDGGAKTIEDTEKKEAPVQEEKAVVKSAVIDNGAKTGEASVPVVAEEKTELKAEVKSDEKVIEQAAPVMEMEEQVDEASSNDNQDPVYVQADAPAELVAFDAAAANAQAELQAKAAANAKPAQAKVKAKASNRVSNKAKAVKTKTVKTKTGAKANPNVKGAIRQRATWYSPVIRWAQLFKF